MTQLIVGAVALIPLAVAGWCARRLVRPHLVVLLLICGAVLCVATGLDDVGDRWVDRLDARLHHEQTAEARR